jgi:hypothetical protein
MAGMAYYARIKCVMIENHDLFVRVLTPTLTLQMHRYQFSICEEDHDLQEMIKQGDVIVYQATHGRSTVWECYTTRTCLSHRYKQQRIQGADWAFNFHYARHIGITIAP